MKRIVWKLISFREGIEHLQGKKILDIKHDYSNTESIFEKCEGPRRGYINETEITYFDDNTVMACTSDWNSGYYGDIDAEDPKFYLGTIIEVSKEELAAERKKKETAQKAAEKRRVKEQAKYWNEQWEKLKKK